MFELGNCTSFQVYKIFGQNYNWQLVVHVQMFMSVRVFLQRVNIPMSSFSQYYTVQNSSLESIKLNFASSVLHFFKKNLQINKVSFCRPIPKGAHLFYQQKGVLSIIFLKLKMVRWI